MNESLISPFNITHPTTVQTSLFALASFARFDPTGRYVATGRVDGTAAIWDLDTRAAVRILDGHVKAVSSLDWSRHSRYVLTASKDWNVVVWDLASSCVPAQRCLTLRFDAPVVSASFHPRNSRIILALMTTGEAYLVDQRKAHRARVELCEVQEESDDEGAATSTRVRSAITVARFDPSGKHIFLGTNGGYILVFNTHTKTMVARHKITGAGAIKGLEFTKTGRRLVSNSADRTLRQFTVPIYPPPTADGAYIEQELEPTHRFNDPINKTAWHAVSYSPDGEWLAGGAADAANHKIYIWDISNDGQFASALDGGREPLLHLHWHPSKSSIASTTNQGNILIWHCPHPERWGAFAGGFEELDENVEYEEREDEFDIEDEADMIRRKMKAEEEEVDIDTMPEAAKPREVQLHGVQPGDEDVTWADEEPDDDQQDWKMGVIMEEDWDL
ncbi:WD40-repeat-containing domain protein [Mycena albidolilacea]|uniref:WD40-repeat-containing domain protein n=1 Tax=Mycena albidolilacea TaxID=1033008 RepID=A0AAD7ATX8_9AGAR|nr:WD40-repeat-containing domain protein [Mycena albidolilacea]